MSNPYYGHTTYPPYGSQSSSIQEAAEWVKVQSAFDKLPTLSGYGNYLTKVNAGETALVPSNVSVTDAGAMTVPAGLTVSAGIVDLTATVPKVPTAPTGTSTTQAASTEFAAALAFQSALPGQLNNGGKVIVTNGIAASWSFIGTAAQTIRVNAAGTSLEGYTPSVPTGAIICLAQTAGGF